MIVTFLYDALLLILSFESKHNMEGECFMHYGFWLITRIILNAVITILTFLAIFVSVSEENKVTNPHFHTKLTKMHQELVENEEITQLFNQTVRVKTYW